MAQGLVGAKVAHNGQLYSDGRGCFEHSQLYVALSRVSDLRNLSFASYVDYLNMIVDQDRPRNQIIELVQGYHDCGYKIIFMSGRDGSCRELTEMWLADMGLDNYELFMRPEGSFEKDVVVKERLFWEDVADNYNVKVVVDDRPTVVRLWHELGIQNVICVGNPWKEF
jgi:hypothetical protein